MRGNHRIALHEKAKQLLDAVIAVISDMKDDNMMDRDGRDKASQETTTMPTSTLERLKHHRLSKKSLLSQIMLLGEKGTKKASKKLLEQDFYPETKLKK